jgi:hypothetical protein
LQKGEKIEIGKPRPEKSYYAPYIGADSALLEVYTSTSGSPSFITGIINETELLNNELKVFGNINILSLLNSTAVFNGEFSKFS